MREGHDPRPIRIIKTDSTDGASAVTFAAEDDQYHSVRWILCSYSAIPTGGALTVVIGSTTVLDIHVPAIGPFPFAFDPGLATKTLNKACVVTLADPGGSIVSKLSVGVQ